jgi:N-acetylmuramic acid 6-phosphate etherase
VTDRASDLDLLPTVEILELMSAADHRAAAAVREVVPKTARCADAIAARLRAGGRLHVFGAGTSGRLAVLDASECPPTFGVPSDLVQGHIAGGDRALTQAIEGAEDDEADGAAQVAACGITGRDVVIAVSASGRTPWCLGVLRHAKSLGATTVAVTCTRPSPMQDAAAFAIDPAVGDEVLRGSTRLAAGTAQKLVLNMISTAVMVRLGRTYGNLMVGVQPTNQKLRSRARDVIRAVTGRTEGVEAALEAAGNDVRIACVMLARDVGREEAERLLSDAGSLRGALGAEGR